MSSDCSISAYAGAISQGIVDASRITPPGDVDGLTAGAAAGQALLNKSQQCAKREGSVDCTPKGYAIAAYGAADGSNKISKVVVHKVEKSILKRLGITPAAKGCVIGGVGGAIGGALAGFSVGGPPAAIVGAKQGAESGCAVGSIIIPPLQKVTTKIKQAKEGYQSAEEAYRGLKEHSKACGIAPELRALQNRPTPSEPGQNSQAAAMREALKAESKVCPLKPPLTAESYKGQLQQDLAKERFQNQALNPFTPQQHFQNAQGLTQTPWQSGMSGRYHYTPYSPYSHSPYSQTTLFRQWVAEQRVREAVRNELYSPNPNLYSLYLRACSNVGFGQLLNYSTFSSIVSSCSLVSEYNMCNPYNQIRDPFGLYRDIGGVGNRVSIIEDMIDSTAHAEAKEYYFCFPEGNFPLSFPLFQQIMRELYQGYFTHHTIPFFSLHFNEKGFMYPVLHPAYNNTLIGEIIAILDYWMKGFLNGGIFDEEFLKIWHEGANCDEGFLRTKLIDLKKYCKERCNGLPYSSLREVMGRYGLKEEVANSSYRQPFKTSFRIIASQERVERHENLLIPHPTFTVEYSIDLMPDYENYLETYFKENGSYPEEYLQTRRCYEEFAEEVKEKMPQMPFCRDYFRLLGAINSMCYFFATLKQMGKMPLLDPLPPVHTYPSPKAYPPIPIRYYRRYPLKISLEELIEKMRSYPESDGLFREVLAGKSVRQLPAPLAEKVKLGCREVMSAKLAPQFSPGETFSLDDDELERVSKKAHRVVLKHLYQVHASFNHLLQQLSLQLPRDAQRHLLSLPLSERAVAAKAALESHHKIVSERWESLPPMTEEALFAELSRELPPDMRPMLLKTFREIEKQTVEQIGELIPQQEGQVLLCQQEIQRIEQLIAQVPAHLRHLPQVQQAIQALAELRANLAEMQAHVLKLSQTRTEITQYRAARSQKSSASGQSSIVGQIRQDLTGEPQEAVPPIPDGLVKSWKMSTLAALENIIKGLDNIGQKIGNFSALIMESENGVREELNGFYTRPFIAFSGQDLPELRGERFRIVGGCGMRMPNMRSVSIAEGEHFYSEAIAACPEVDEEKVTFKKNGRSYALFKVSVADAADVMAATEVEVEESPAEPALTALTEQCTSDAPSPLPKELTQPSLDKGGCKLIHYAAAVMDKNRFAKLLSTTGQVAASDTFGNRPIHVAAYAGNAEVIEAIAAADLSQIEAVNANGATPLHLAVQYRNYSAVEKLLALGAQANRFLPNGLFPLFIAIQSNFSEIALLLLDRCPALAVNEKMDSGVTPLHLSVAHGLEELTIRLIERAASMEAKRLSDGYTPWHAAASKGNVALLKAMKERGANIHQTLESQKSALHLAAEEGHFDAVQFLLASQLSVDLKTTDGDTPLMLAIKKGHRRVAELLAETSAINAVNPVNQTASYQAIQYGLPSVADILFERGENPELLDNQGYHAFYHLVKSGDLGRISALADRSTVTLSKIFDGESYSTLAARHGHTLLFYELLERGVALKSPQKGLEAIHYAVMVDESDFLREWLEENRSEKKMKTLSLLAAKQGSVRCLMQLLRKLSLQEVDERELLAAALEGGTPECVQLLLRRLRDINAPLTAKSQSRALHLAAATGSLQLVLLLLNSGSDPKIEDARGETAFHIALRQGDHRLLRSLFKKVPPEDWPADLVPAKGEAFSDEMKRVFASYKNRLPDAGSSALSLKAASEENAPSDHPQELQADIDTLLRYFDFEVFENAADIIEETPALLEEFRSLRGGELFAEFLSNITLSSLSSSKRLFTLLRDGGVDPLIFRKEKNPLLAAVKGGNDELACCRLHLFAEYFPKSILTLAQEEIHPEVNIACIALKNKMRNFFFALDELCRKAAADEGKNFSSLHMLVTEGEYTWLESLLKTNPVDALNEKHRTPLMVAAAKNNTKMMGLLLAKGARPEAVDLEGGSALHYALSHKSEAAALQLLPLLRKKNLPDKRGNTPLSLAAANGILSAVRYLCSEADYSQEVDRDGHTALHVAALMGQKEVVHHLVERGFAIDQVEAPTNSRRIARCLQHTPLHLAALKGKADVVALLLALGADPKKRNRIHESVSECAIISKDADTLSVVKNLSCYHEKESETSLFLAAAKANHKELLREMLINGANVNAFSRGGLSALHIATASNAGETLEILLASPDVIVDAVDSDGDTPLHYAARRGSVRLIEALIRVWAEIDKPNQKGETPLFAACKEGHAGAVAALLKWNADPMLPSEKGETPMDIARALGNEKIISRLAKATCKE